MFLKKLDVHYFSFFLCRIGRIEGKGGGELHSLSPLSQKIFWVL